MAKGTLITFPKGVAVYPALNRPDTKYDELGQYKADFKVTSEVAEPFIKQLQKVAKDHTGRALPKAKNSVWYMELDDDGEETGMVVFKVRVKNKNRKSDGKLWDRRPLVIDAKKNDMPVDVAVWGGSVIRVQAEVYEWQNNDKKGVTLQPVMVQVIELVTGGSRGDSSAFDEEDGYETEETTGADRAAFDADEAGDDEDY